jgi:CPA2 family monovalent cation:H+ antiporter-2
MAITLLLVVGAAGTAGVAGLSSAFGAFLAGLLLSESEYRHQIEIDLEPFKGLLLGLFFMTVGMMVDPFVLFEQGWVLLAGLAVLLIVKALACFVASRLFGVAMPVAAELALLLVQAGEFALVIIGLARTVGVVTAEVAHISIGIVVLSMMITPLIGMLAARLGTRLEHGGTRATNPATDYVDHVIISGYGRVGQVIARMLDSEHVPYVAFETDSEIVRQHQKTRGRVFFGDTARPAMLERAGARRARAFLVTLDTAAATERVVRAILRHRPDACILARAHDAAHAKHLLAMGVKSAIPETVETSLVLGSRVLDALGLPEEAITRRVELAREAELGTLGKGGAAAS